MYTFKKYLVELLSTGDDNAIGGIIHKAKHNLKSLSRQEKTLAPVCKSLLDNLSGIEQHPASLYIDGYSIAEYLQRLTNPKIDINELKTINDAIGGMDGDSE